MLRTALVALAVTTVVAGCASAPTATKTAHSPTARESGSPAPSRPPIELRPDRHAGTSAQLGIADGDLPDGVSVFADEYPAVANLEPDLLRAVRAAATDALGDSVAVVVNSGWRSTEYQEHLLDEAIQKYGSRKKAAQWVATPLTSAHVSGSAIDLGPASAEAWLAEHGAEYGLCQTYANEPWHYELRPRAVDRGCPHPYADPAHDPRMQ